MRNKIKDMRLIAIEGDKVVIMVNKEDLYLVESKGFKRLKRKAGQLD